MANYQFIFICRILLFFIKIMSNGIVSVDWNDFYDFERELEGMK